MSFNKVELSGNVGNVSELKQTSTGREWFHFSLATNDGTQDNPKTNWHNVSVFGKLASVHKHIQKGTFVRLEGRIDYNKRDDKTYTSIIPYRLTYKNDRTPSNTSFKNEIINSDLQITADDIPF